MLSAATRGLLAREPEPPTPPLNPEITHYARAIAIDWMLETSFDACLGTDAFHTGVLLLDRAIARCHIELCDLQCLAGACLFVGAKLHECDSLRSSEFTVFGGGSYTAQQLRDAEGSIVIGLCDFIWAPTPMDFLHDATHGRISPAVVQLANAMLMESGQFRASRIAAACAFAVGHVDSTSLGYWPRDIVPEIATALRLKRNLPPTRFRDFKSKMKLYNYAPSEMPTRAFYSKAILNAVTGSVPVREKTVPPVSPPSSECASSAASPPATRKRYRVHT